MPGNVQQFAESLCRALIVPQEFWVYRGHRHKATPRERFVMICLIERMMQRYGRSTVDIAEMFGMSRGSLWSKYYTGRSSALWTMYPDLRQAVIRLDGELAGEFIVEHWRLPIMRVCGE